MTAGGGDPATIRASVAADLREGAALVWRHEALRRIGLANAVMNVGNTAFFAVAVLLVIGPLGLPRSAFGVALALFAAGGVLGSLVQERVVRRLGHRRVMMAGAVVVGLGYGLICLTADRRGAPPAAAGRLARCWHCSSRSTSTSPPRAA